MARRTLAAMDEGAVRLRQEAEAVVQGEDRIHRTIEASHPPHRYAGESGRGSPLQAQDKDEVARRPPPALHWLALWFLLGGTMGGGERGRGGSHVVHQGSPPASSTSTARRHGLLLPASSSAVPPNSSMGAGVLRKMGREASLSVENNKCAVVVVSW